MVLEIRVDEGRGRRGPTFEVEGFGSDIIYHLRGIKVSFTPNFRILTPLLRILDIEGEGRGGSGAEGGIGGNGWGVCPISFMVQGVGRMSIEWPNG